jgi:hypothetical protein
VAAAFAFAEATNISAVAEISPILIIDFSLVFKNSAQESQSTIESSQHSD